MQNLTAEITNKDMKRSYETVWKLMDYFKSKVVGRDLQRQQPQRS